MIIKFRQPEFRKGINVTVRRGDKWYKRGKVGEYVDIVETDKEENILGTGQIVALRYCSFLDIRDDEMEFGKPRFHNFFSLSQAMKRAYPDFDSEEMITLVTFYV